MLRARCVTLKARWVTLRARWVTLSARWVTLKARWVTLRACWVTLKARWVASTGERAPVPMLSPGEPTSAGSTRGMLGVGARHSPALASRQSPMRASVCWSPPLSGSPPLEAPQEAQVRHSTRGEGKHPRRVDGVPEGPRSGAVSNRQGVQGCWEAAPLSPSEIRASLSEISASLSEISIHWRLSRTCE
jgi:hypothetical protein